MGNLSHLHSNVIPQHDTTRLPFSKVLTVPNTLPFQLKQSTFVYVLLSVFLTTTQVLCWTPAFLHHLLFATSIKVIVDFFFLYLSHTTSEYKLANPNYFLYRAGHLLTRIQLFFCLYFGQPCTFYNLAIPYRSWNQPLWYIATVDFIMNTCPKKPYDECKLRDLYMDIVGHPLYCISLLPVFQPHLTVYFPTGSNILI